MNQQLTMLPCSSVFISSLVQAVLQLLVQSFCPLVLGQDLVKFGLLLSLFSAPNENAKAKERTAIHVAVIEEQPINQPNLIKALIDVTCN